MEGVISFLPARGEAAIRNYMETKQKLLHQRRIHTKSRKVLSKRALKYNERKTVHRTESKIRKRILREEKETMTSIRQPERAGKYLVVNIAENSKKDFNNTSIKKKYFMGPKDEVKIGMFNVRTASSNYCLNRLVII